MDEMMLYHYFEAKAEGDKGEFSGIASIYGVEDLQNDVVDKGAFTKTVSENPTVKIQWMHRQDEVIGLGEVKEWQGKLMVKGTLDMDDPRAQYALSKMKKGLITGLSIGYKTVKSTFQNAEDRLIRHLQEVKLFEVSIVTHPALPGAQIMHAKELALIQDMKKEYSALVARIEALEAKMNEPPSPAAEPVDDHSGLNALFEEIGNALH